jgi:3-methyladenine DNA glycosylase AlkD
MRTRPAAALVSNDVKEIVTRLDRALKQAGTAERAAQEKRYLKSEIEHYGADSKALKAAVRAEMPIKSLGHDDVIAIVEGLWAKPIFERRAASVIVLDRAKKLLGPDDLPLLEDLLRRSKTWALVDYLAVHVVGPLVEAHPALNRTLDRWAKDDDFWIRRSAMLALLVPLREGRGDLERFGRYANAMLDETEFFIRKAIGWILRDTARKRPAEVAAWLLPRAARASGVTMREAVKYLPAKDRDALLRARSSGARPRRARSTPPRSRGPRVA